MRLQYVLDGLSVGSVYALVALGLVIIYRGTGQLNFAQGEMGLFASYLVYQFGEWGVAVLPAVALAVMAAFALGAATETLLVRPLSRRSPMAVVVVTLALLQGLNWLDMALWGDQPLPSTPFSDQRRYPTLFPSGERDFVRILGAAWREQYVGILATSVLLCAALQFMVRRTRLGLAMRVVADDGESAALLGVPVARIRMFSWALAAAISGFAAIVFAGTANGVHPGLMSTVFVYGAAAATLGGFTSPGGAIVGALSIGVVEQVAAGTAPDWVGQQMKLTVAVLAIVVVLMVRPAGLFGRVAERRA